MSWDVELAKQFKQRDNKSPIGAQIGEVISNNPLKISILGNNVILEKEHCYMCSYLTEQYLQKADLRIKEYTASISLTDSHGDSSSTLTVHDKNNYDIEIKYKEILNVGDLVLCIPTVDGQRYFLIDKVVM